MADKIKFQTGVPSLITIKRDDCWFKDHPEYGKTFTYMVLQEWTDPGTDEQMHAEGYAYLTESLHKEFTKAGAGKGALLKVLKREVPQEGKKPRTEWQVRMVTHPDKFGMLIKDKENNVIGSTATDDMEEPPSNPKTGEKAPAAPQDQRSPSRHVPTLSSLSVLLRDCVEASRWVWSEDPEATREDIRSVAVTLFIEANKKGITSEKGDLEPVAQDDHPPPGDSDLPFSLAFLLPLGTMIMGTMIS